jgi:hypothetical protein
MKMKFFAPFKDEGEVVAAWGPAQLIKYLDGKVELKGGQKGIVWLLTNGSRCSGMERWSGLNGESGEAYFRNSQRRNVRSKLTRMQVTSGKWKEKFPLE